VEEDALSIVMTPVQLAAVLSGQPINEKETLTNRLWGGVTLLAGSLELVGAGALLLVPEPTMATKVGGVALGVHGSDTASTGLWQIWTGLPQRTLTNQAAAEVAKIFVTDTATTETIGTGVDIAVPLIVSLGVGAARLAAVRVGRISLIEHEAVAGSRLGGHTMLKHIGKTEAEMRGRLFAQPRITAVSTFKTLEVAERTLYEAMKANRAAIEAWARAASPGATEAFYYMAASPVGQGVVRATNTMVQMNKVKFVLKMQQYNGKLYYILTAFPIP